MKTARSKKFAWTLLAITTLLTGYCVSQGYEGAGSAIFSTGTLAAVGLYANKQHTDNKKLEIEKGK